MNKGIPFIKIADPKAACVPSHWFGDVTRSCSLQYYSAIT